MLKSTGLFRLFIICVLSFVLSHHAIAATETPGQFYRVQQPGASEMVMDALLIRPLALATTVVGTGLFIVTWPFSALGGNVDQAAQKLIIEPAKATFARCLGCETL